MVDRFANDSSHRFEFLDTTPSGKVGPKKPPPWTAFIWRPASQIDTNGSPNLPAQPVEITSSWGSFSEMDGECTMNVDGKAVVMNH